jgi:hypothetical protein
MGLLSGNLASIDPQFYQGVPYLLARYFHVVCTALIVGGTLFFEWVVPVAIKDLQPAEQLAVFGRARWFFRRIVWVGAALLLITGFISSTQHFDSYRAPEPEDISVTLRVGWWWVAHAATGVLALLIALMLNSLPVPPSHPVGWMRANLIVLMIVIFFGSVTGHVRVERRQQELAAAMSMNGGPARRISVEPEEVTTAPSTAGGLIPLSHPTSMPATRP